LRRRRRNEPFGDRLDENRHVKHDYSTHRGRIEIVVT